MELETSLVERPDAVTLANLLRCRIASLAEKVAAAKLAEEAHSEKVSIKESTLRRFLTLITIDSPTLTKTSCLSLPPCARCTSVSRGIPHRYSSTRIIRSVKRSLLSRLTSGRAWASGRRRRIASR